MAHGDCRQALEAARRAASGLHPRSGPGWARRGRLGRRDRRVVPREGRRTSLVRGGPGCGCGQ
eukprot:7296258-Alexandrium_andersonii.AAC.1